MTLPVKKCRSSFTSILFDSIQSIIEKIFSNHSLGIKLFHKSARADQPDLLEKNSEITLFGKHCY